ncbi:MAG: hypothetical protein ISR49_09875 [Alphaproteobacteria bacterium]|nr:hypothetical protein [Alphaproteobacteria bacterium]
MAVSAASTLASATPCRVIAVSCWSSVTPLGRAIKTSVRWLSCQSGVGIEMRQAWTVAWNRRPRYCRDRDGSARSATFSLINLCLTDRSKTASSMG